MKDIELIMSAVNADIRRKADERGQLGIGELAALLRATNPDKVVVAETPLGPVSVSPDVISYRGYYDQLAIEPDGQSTAGILAAALSEAIGETFQGYKGGDYSMSRNTPVWLSRYGDASGYAVTGVVEAADAVILNITEEEW